METTVFQREFLYVKQLHEKGELGRIQYMTCAHYQDMEGWPSYWNGFPPLMHPTHAVAPCLMLAGHLPKRVYGRGSGKIRDELVAQYNSPFAFESALIELENSDLTIEMERFLYGVARSYSECFRIYGEKKSFEWQQLASESPVFYTRTGALREVETYKLDGDPERFFRGSEIKEERVEIPDFADRLPKEIAHFTRQTVYNDKNTHLSFKQGGGHGGSQLPCAYRRYHALPPLYEKAHRRRKGQLLYTQYLLDSFLCAEPENDGLLLDKSLCAQLHKVASI